MPRFEVDITVEDARNALNDLCDQLGLDAISELDGTRYLEIDALVDRDSCIDEAVEQGYIHSDDALDGLDPHLRDLQDGLRTLIAGDRAMAAILIARALSEWPDAVRVVEETLGARTHHDRRQLTLLAA